MMIYHTAPVRRSSIYSNRITNIVTNWLGEYSNFPKYGLRFVKVLDVLVLPSSAPIIADGNTGSTSVLPPSLAQGGLFACDVSNAGDYVCDYCYDILPYLSDSPVTGDYDSEMTWGREG